MDPRNASYDLQELSAEAGVTPRTVRYYIQQGLLPAPEQQGPATRYGRSHLDRLRLIRQLQAEHQPLAVIRKRLEELRDEDVRRLVTNAPPSKAPSSAVDYVRSVLGGSPSRARSAAAVLSVSPLALRPPSPGRSEWDRISLAPDVELHVRRPLTRDANRRVQKLLDLARQILQEDE
jgi:DNA-binding transcriptional MerR regulator